MTEEKCRLCLADCPLSLVEDYDLRWMVDKIFYFKIYRDSEDPTLICEACREAVIGFHGYAENVWKNQQFLRANAVPFSGGIVSKVELHNPMPSVSGVGSKAVITPRVKPDPDRVAKIERVEIEEESPLPVAYLQTSMRDSGESMEEDEEDKDDDGDREWVVPDGGDEPDEEDEDSGDDKEPKDQSKAVKIKKSVKIKKEVSPKKPSPKSELEEQLLRHYNLSCDLCGQPLSDFMDLLRHFKKIHNQPGYLNCCNKKIFRKYSMIEHLQVHLNPDTFHCAICKKSYSTSNSLKDHTKEVHTPIEERSIKCDTCLKLFATQRALSAHFKAAHGSIPCPECGKLLASQGSLKKHLDMMHGDGGQHVCDVCARVFRTKACFDKHVKMHLGTLEVDRVQCTLCFAWLTDKNCLRKHMLRIHSGADEVVSCQVCGRVQRNQIMLRHHMARAHGESRFECDVCFKKFKRPHHMREHKAIHHTGEDLYGCDYCPERFNNKNRQCLHRKTCHPVEFEEEMRRRAMKDM